MSYQRILSAEQLEAWLFEAGAICSCFADKHVILLLLKHIVALTEQHAAELARVTVELEQGHAAYRRLCDSLEIAGDDLARATKERDEWKTRHMDAISADPACPTCLGAWGDQTSPACEDCKGNGTAKGALAALKAERDAIESNLDAANDELREISAMVGGEWDSRQSPEVVTRTVAERAEDTARLRFMFGDPEHGCSHEELKTIWEGATTIENARELIDAARAAGKRDP